MWCARQNHPVLHSAEADYEGHGAMRQSDEELAGLVLEGHTSVKTTQRYAHVLPGQVQPDW